LASSEGFERGFLTYEDVIGDLVELEGSRIKFFSSSELDEVSIDVVDEISLDVFDEISFDVFDEISLDGFAFFGVSKDFEQD
jgi:hypothetical protein